LAAQLGKEMLAENDSLQKEVKNFRKEFDNSVKVRLYFYKTHFYLSIRKNC